MKVHFSKLERASKRVVSQRSDGSFEVEGRPQLGDQFPSYTVVHLPNGELYCDCYGRLHGERRAREICSHVKAVQIWLRRH